MRRKEMTASASRIQSAWRLFWFLQIGPRIRKARFGNAATMVQKWMKGYLCKKHCYKELMNVKVNSCYDHFMKIKSEREIAARLILRYHITKYFMKKKVKKLADLAKKKALALKKAEDEKKRKGKYGYGGPPKKKAKPKPKPVSENTMKTGKTLDATSLTAMTEGAGSTTPLQEGAEEDDEPDREMGLEDN